MPKSNNKNPDKLKRQWNKELLCFEEREVGSKEPWVPVKRLMESKPEMELSHHDFTQENK